MRNPKTNHVTRITILAACLFVSLTLSGCSGQAMQPVSKSDYLLNTLVTISIYETGAGADKSSEIILDDCIQKCKEYEQLFSRTAEGSDISRINENAPEFVTVSEDTAALLETALSYCELSGGRLDITIAPVKELWGFSEPETASVPDENALEEALQHVDYRCVEIDGRRVRLTDPKAAIDLGFIAKGYIADRLKEYLLSEHVTSAIINLGGNVLTVGDKHGQPFQVGIQKPFADSGVICTSVACTDSSVVTSGVYERYFTQDNRNYHHILEPSTGYPSRSGLLSATILSPDSTTGDALSTACVLLGAEEAISLIDSIDGVEAVLITENYEILRTDE